MYEINSSRSPRDPVCKGILKVTKEETTEGYQNGNYRVMCCNIMQEQEERGVCHSNRSPSMCRVLVSILNTHTVPEGKTKQNPILGRQLKLIQRDYSR